MIAHPHTGTIHGFEIDWDANAAYIHLSDKPFAYGKELDAERRIDFAEDGTPVGVEITCLRSGVLLDNLPVKDEIKALLTRHDIPVSG
jgi:uncharacterized protein YuzE